MDIQNQKSKEKNSPNIGGDVKNCHFGDNLFVDQKTKSIQVKTITNLILCISNSARSAVREDTEKDLKEKLEKRFAKYNEDLRVRYAELLGIYSFSYDEAKKYLNFGDTTSDKIALYLKGKSNEILAKNNYDPLISIRELVTFFSNELDRFLPDNKEYDSVAIEFYLIKELIACNIFPNPISK